MPHILATPNGYTRDIKTPRYGTPTIVCKAHSSSSGYRPILLQIHIVATPRGYPTDLREPECGKPTIFCKTHSSSSGYRLILLQIHIVATPDRWVAPKISNAQNRKLDYDLNDIQLSHNTSFESSHCCPPWLRTTPWHDNHPAHRNPVLVARGSPDSISWHVTPFSLFPLLSP